jgi:alpha/beta superfamily hydrolase
MRNNVVRGLGNRLAQKRLLTLRFDYRGVGRSQGPVVDVARHLAEFWRTSHVAGEMDLSQDLQAAVDFIDQADPGVPLVLVGYSFGCVLLASTRSQRDPAALVLIAPTVTKHNYDAFRSISSPLLVVASEDDFATEAQMLDDWVATLTMPWQVVRQQCDNHFFRGHEDWLVDTILCFLDGRWR